MLRIIIILFLPAVLTIANVSAQRRDKSGIVKQQGDLDEVRQQINERQKALDSLREAEAQLISRKNDFDQRISSDRQVITRLNRELSQLRQAIGNTSEQLESRQDLLDRTQRRYLGSIRQFYIASRQSEMERLGNSNLELVKQRQVVYLAAMAEYETENISGAEQLLTEAVGELDRLQGRTQTVSSLKKNKETSVALGQSQASKAQRNINQVRQKSLEESDRLVMLQKAAEEMEAIIARLQDEHQATSGKEVATVSVFHNYQGQLTPPCRGQIVSRFGNHTDPVTKLKSFSPGITLAGKSGRTVRAVAAGTVAYAGELRGYGNFVIINHDGEYFTTYAGLGQIDVVQGKYVSERAKLGTAGGDGQVKFEIRKGREALDPVKWIKIESL